MTIGDHVLRLCAVLTLSLGGVLPAAAAEWHVAPGGTGTGSAAAPFGRIQLALNLARGGDTIRVAAGTYAESLRTVRPGTPEQPIVLRAAGPRGSVVVTAAGRVLTVDHAYTTVEGFVFDGQYGADDTVRIASSAHFLTLRDLEVRRSTLDLIDMGAPSGVVIERCLIHHALNAAAGRTDAHGIAAGAVRQLTVRDTEIHTFSGDGLQVDPGRAAPGWNGVTLERVHIWLAPLPAAENGFAAGIVPGENAVDTKANAHLARATLTIRDSTASGFKGGLIDNMAAFNLKEHIDATIDGVTVFDSEIAFRVRGGGAAPTGAWVAVRNAVIHSVAVAFRYEDDIERLRISNSTIGRDVARPFRAAASRSAGLEVRNLLVLGARPVEADHGSNLSVDADAFVDAAAGDYHLAPGSPAIDRGEPLDGVVTDRDGQPRPAGQRIDVGAYEWRPPPRARR